MQNLITHYMLFHNMKINLDSILRGYIEKVKAINLQYQVRQDSQSISQLQLPWPHSHQASADLVLNTLHHVYVFH